MNNYQGGRSKKEMDRPGTSMSLLIYVMNGILWIMLVFDSLTIPLRPRHIP